jgi:hypothetical protein
MKRWRLIWLKREGHHHDQRIWLSPLTIASPMNLKQQLERLENKGGVVIFRLKQGVPYDEAYALALTEWQTDTGLDEPKGILVIIHENGYTISQR